MYELKKKEETLEYIDYKYVKTTYKEQAIYTFAMKVKEILSIQYVASRGQNTEAGSVQRILNKSRISKIREFILADNSFVNTFILNWTNKNYEPKIKKETISIPFDGHSAQILDGQHRIAGLAAAIEVNTSIGETEILVSLCIGLDTPQAAKIFLNINSEQKPVPKSLIYDLFGEAVDDKDHAINRAVDIINYLNETEVSPFFNRVKFPGSARGTGLIDLAIMTNAMKSHLEPGGAFSSLKLNEIEMQKKIIENFYLAIKKTYSKAGIWAKSNENPFLKSAGFSGAFEFLVHVLLPRCQVDKDFTINNFMQVMNLDEDDLITTHDFKALDGKTAKKTVTNYFTSMYAKVAPGPDEYKI
jgi:DGQHR domain-containing protein